MLSQSLVIRSRGAEFAANVGNESVEAANEVAKEEIERRTEENVIVSYDVR